MENKKNTRREFIKRVGAGSALAAISTHAAFPAFSVKKPKKTADVALNLGLQEGVTPGKTLNEKLDFLEAN